MIFKKNFHPVFLTTSIIIIIFTASSAQSAYLRWNANSEEDVAGYRVHYGTSSGQYGLTANVGNQTSYDLSNLYLYEDEVYFIAITAYDCAGNESELPEELYVSLDEGVPAFADNCPAIYNRIR